ncbi:MAG: 1-acyl-sn-glycerol-3-phosphate acyltransferase [Rhodospirillaceae bacterium]|nr:1-acyl-sn-glycerol-3-phosphate acyltransferase [Rhodospirillaceae bacterium]
MITAVFSAGLTLIQHALRIDSGRLRRDYYRFLVRLLGLKLIVRGEQATARPRLIVSNHISYFDIIGLGATITGEFVAKAELASWPFFGTLSKIARVVFIDRKRQATRAARDQLQERLDAGATLIMFPEATSGDGNRMKPFKSALFTVAERQTGQPVTIQPVSIAYTRLNGMPMGVGWRPYVAWYGDMDLIPHLRRLLELGTITCEITFHPPVTAADFPDRKALAAHCERITRDGFARLLAGRENA